VVVSLWAVTSAKQSPAQQVAVAEKLILVFIESNLGHKHQMIGSYFANPFSAKLKRYMLHLPQPIFK